MMAAMNKLQNEYEFVGVPTTARRRYQDFDKDKFDMMMFESINWGWQQYPVAASQAFITGVEVVILSKEYLNYHFTHSPADKAKLLYH